LTAEVHDEAGIFLKAAIEREPRDKEIKRQFKEISWSKPTRKSPRRGRRITKPEAKNRFFEQWARERARAAELTAST